MKTEEPPAPPEPEAAKVQFSLILAVWMLVLLGAIALLWAAREFFIPLILGITIAYVLRPMVNGMVAMRIPRSIAALAAVLSVVGTLGFGAYSLSDDAATLLETIPKAVREVRIAMQDSRTHKPRAMHQVQEAARELDKAAAAASGQAPGAAPAPSATPSLGTRLQEYVVAQGVMILFTLGQALFVFLLTWFVLSEGDTFKRKLVRIVGPSLERKKITVRILDQIDQQVQRQMGAMFIANMLIGVGTAIAFTLFGMEQAALWGVVAGLLHFIPYVGQAIITLVSSAAAYLQFGDAGSAFAVGLTTVALSFVIGTVLMTFMQSRASRINATVLFVAILFFGWLWGAWGLVLASPIVAIFKSVCDNVEAFAPMREFMSGPVAQPAPATPAPAE